MPLNAKELYRKTRTLVQDLAHKVSKHASSCFSASSADHNSSFKSDVTVMYNPSAFEEWDEPPATPAPKLSHDYPRPSMQLSSHANPHLSACADGLRECRSEGGAGGGSRFKCNASLHNRSSLPISSVPDGTLQDSSLHDSNSLPANSLFVRTPSSKQQGRGGGKPAPARGEPFGSIADPNDWWFGDGARAEAGGAGDEAHASAAVVSAAGVHQRRVPKQAWGA